MLKLKKDECGTLKGQRFFYVNRPVFISANNLKYVLIA
jgi:hypothetical protein